MTKILLLIVGIALIHTMGHAQGCATVRNIPDFGQYLSLDRESTSSLWTVSITNRYYKAARDFRGTEDVSPDPKNESINRNFATEFAVSHLMQRGWSLTLVIPVLANAREASREHGGPDTERYTTRAFGIGDVRFTVSKWILDPVMPLRGNIQVGLGLKFPTGDFAQKDYFHRNGATILAPVNPGIQPGDGGLGLIVETNAYYHITDPLGMYMNIYYMANPREHNGESWGGFTFTESQVQAGENVMSVPDAFSLRGGLYYDLLADLTLSCGIRYEGVPVKDLVGGSMGSRRPGYYFSVEPGVVVRTNRVSFFGYVPLIVSRSIKQTVGGKLIGAHFPGGSADYMIFFGALFKL